MFGSFHCFLFFSFSFYFSFLPLPPLRRRRPPLLLGGRAWDAHAEAVRGDSYACSERVVRVVVGVILQRWVPWEHHHAGESPLLNPEPLLGERVLCYQEESAFVFFPFFVFSALSFFFFLGVVFFFLSVDHNVRRAELWSARPSEYLPARRGGSHDSCELLPEIPASTSPRCPPLRRTGMHRAHSGARLFAF